MSTPDEQLSGERATAQGNPSSEAAELESLRAALTEAQAKAQESREQQLRALAELENIRKRAQRDVEQAHRYALEKFVAELVGVKDSLELGLVAEKAEAKDLLSGMEATLKLLSKAFDKAGVLELVPEGEAFNPELHEAMVSQPSAEQPPNTVLKVIQKGYQLNGRLLRPARVIVARSAD
jgi:molecular chaperone GrpE